MSASKSILSPQHPNWYQDLPDNGVAQTQQPCLAPESVNRMDEQVLELTRETTYARGLFLMMGAGGILFSLYLLHFSGQLSLKEVHRPFDLDLFLLNLLLMAGILASSIFYLYLIKFDIGMPRDLPVRFDRAARKVFSLEQKRFWNPFVRWPVTPRAWDWDNVHAEITKVAGFNGKTYVQRFHLILSHCKPGTLEVEDRIVLEGNSVLTVNLESTWAYVCKYMQSGMDGLPRYPIRRQEINFRRSLFQYMRILDPSEEGREMRQFETSSLDRGFTFVVSILLIRLLLPMRFFHYIAMRLAPPTKWPDDVGME